MTEDEIKTMQAELETLKSQQQESAKMIADLTAERDSFKKENDALLASNAELKDSEKKLKETNFTLARHLDVSQQQKSAEEILSEMFK